RTMTPKASQVSRMRPRVSYHSPLTTHHLEQFRHRFAAVCQLYRPAQRRVDHRGRIDAERLEDGRRHVAWRDGPVRDISAKLVGGAHYSSALHAAAGHHDRKRIGPMVAA